jgi:hypothetical protein
MNTYASTWICMVKPHMIQYEFTSAKLLAKSWHKMVGLVYFFWREMKLVCSVQSDRCLCMTSGHLFFWHTWTTPGLQD